MISIDETLNKIYERKFTSKQGMKNFVSEVTGNNLDNLQQLKNEVETFRQNKKGEFELRKQFGVMKEPEKKVLSLHAGEPWPEDFRKKTLRTKEVLDGLSLLKDLNRIIDEKIQQQQIEDPNTENLRDQEGETEGSDKGDIHPTDKRIWLEKEYEENREGFNTDQEWAEETAKKFQITFDTRDKPHPNSMKRYGIYKGMH